MIFLIQSNCLNNNLKYTEKIPVILSKSDFQMFTGEIVVHIFEQIVNLVKSVFLVEKKIQIFAPKLFCLERIIFVVKIDKSLGGYQKMCRC